MASSVFLGLPNDVCIVVRAQQRSVRFTLIAVASLGLGLALSASTVSDSQVSGNAVAFAGSTPCDAAIKSLMALPSDPCDFIRWRLNLDTGEPRRFSLAVSFGVAQPNTLGFIGGGRTISSSGTVQVGREQLRGQSVEIYRLDRASGVASIALLRINENLLQVLQPDGTFMVGNDGWSYTLNREQPVSPASKPSFWLGSPLESAARVSTVFDGRTPCHEIADRIGLADLTDCFKVKWSLTLIRDARTLQPTTYSLDRTGHRGSSIEGRWTVSRDGRGDGGPMVYRLDPDSPATSLSFLAVDNSLLFFLDRQGQLLNGNADFSYTLNKR